MAKGKQQVWGPPACQDPQHLPCAPYHRMLELKLEVWGTKSVWGWEDATLEKQTPLLPAGLIVLPADP